MALAEKIIACKAIIRMDLIPSEILEYCRPYMIPEDVERVSGIADRGRWIKGTDELMKSLEEKNEPGWDQEFITALKDKKYAKLIKILDSYPNHDSLVEESNIYRQMIGRSHQIFIGRQLDCKFLIDYLKKDGALGEEDSEIILAKNTLSAQNQELMRCIYRKSLTWFPDLLWGLLQVEKQDVVCELVGIAEEDEVIKQEWCSVSREELRAKCKKSLHEYIESRDDHEVMEESMHAFGFADPEANAEVLACDNYSRYLDAGNETCTNVLLPVQQQVHDQYSDQYPNPNPNVKVVATTVGTHAANIFSGEVSGNNLSDENPKQEENVFEDSEMRFDRKLSGTESPESDDDNEYSYVEAEELELRSYQTELAQPALEGKNTIVVAPTGSGKTHVALGIVKNHHETWDPSKKLPFRVAFLVPTVPLVSQQTKQFRTYLPNLKCKGFSGEYATQGNRAPIGELCRQNDVIVATPQMLVNAIVRDQEISSLSEFSMLIFDECHYANTKNHPYKELARLYVKEKYSEQKQGSENRSLPQVIGLTASVGVGKGSTKLQATEHILKLCGCIAADTIKTVTQNVQELDKYRTVPVEAFHRVQSSPNEFHTAVKKTMDVIEYFLAKAADEVQPKTIAEASELKRLKKPPGQWTSQTYTQWVYGLQRALNLVTDEPSRYRAMYACIEELKMYNEALLLNEFCRADDAFEYLEDTKSRIVKQKSVKHQDSTDEFLTRKFTALKTNLTHICETVEINKKLQKLKEVILEFQADMNNKGSDLRGIIFCKTRQITQALENWMKTDKDLQYFRAHHITSFNVSAEDAGLSPEIQEAVLQRFRSGACKLLIATSVVEVGLDVPECNFIVRFNHVTNETARVQSKGRGRAENSHYVLIGDGDIIEKEELNKQREELMLDAIADINKLNPKIFQEKVQQYSKDIVNESDSRIRVEKQAHSGIKLKCKKCKQYACCPEDIRVIKGIHHVVISPEFEKVSKTEKHPKPKSYDEFMKIGKLFCNHCHSDWGIEQRYKEVNYRVIKISSFLVESPTGQVDVFRNWSAMPFKITDLSIDDHEQVSGMQADALTLQLGTLSVNAT